VHAPTGDKSDDIKDSFYEEIEYVFQSVPKVSHENFVTRFRYKSLERRHYQTNNQE